MFHSWKLNSQVNKLLERPLRIVHQDYASSFTKLLEQDNSTTIHNRNIQLLATELFKLKNEAMAFYERNLCGKCKHYYDLRKELNFREIMLKRCTTELKI